MLAALDEQIAALERELRSHRAVLNDLNELKRARAALLRQPSMPTTWLWASNVPDPDPHHFDGNHNGIGWQA